MLLKILFSKHTTENTVLLNSFFQQLCTEQAAAALNITAGVSAAAGTSDMAPTGGFRWPCFVSVLKKVHNLDKRLQFTTTQG